MNGLMAGVWAMVWLVAGSSASAAGAPPVCQAADMASLTHCAAGSDPARVIKLTADILCTTAEECCPHGAATIDLLGRHDVDLNGDGHTLRRHGGQAQCPALRIQASQNISVHGLSVDDDKTAPPCALSDKACAATVDIEKAAHVSLVDDNFYFGKGYVVRVWNTAGFLFQRSSISDAGIIGLYVGHYIYGPSSGIVIADNVIAHSRTNGIAIQGADGTPSDPVRISGNVLSRNHWHGLWPAEGIPGGITTGGQIFVADGKNIVIDGNLIADGACDNCIPKGQFVMAVEIADVAPAPAGVTNLVIEHNTFLDGFGTAVWQNRRTALSDVTLAGNRTVGFPSEASLLVPAKREGGVLEAAPPSAATLPFRAVRLSVDGVQHMTRRGDAAGGVVQAAFDLSAAPRPGASIMPVLRCSSPAGPNAQSIVAALSCGGAEHVEALLGYPYEKGYPGAKPFYICRPAAPAADAILSWDPACEGKTVLAMPGYALDAR